VKFKLYSVRGCNDDTFAVVCVVQGFFIFVFNALCNRKVCCSFFNFFEISQNLIVQEEFDRIGEIMYRPRKHGDRESTGIKE